MEEISGKQLDIWVWAGDTSAGALSPEMVSEVMDVSTYVWR